jgi:Stress responsive A/B Barrel Domain
MTIRHAVLVRFKLDADVPKIFAALKALQSKIDGILNVSTGADCSPEGLQRGNSHGFTLDFRDKQARDAYLPHPAHQEFGAMMVASVEGGIDGVTVVDWEM